MVKIKYKYTVEVDLSRSTYGIRQKRRKIRESIRENIIDLEVLECLLYEPLSIIHLRF